MREASSKSPADEDEIWRDGYKLGRFTGICIGLPLGVQIMAFVYYLIERYWR